MKKISIIIAIFLTILLIQSCQKENDNVLTDIDGNVYTSVKIGDQIWMVENLKTTKYRNGDIIGTTELPTLDISLETEPKYQWAFGANENKVSTYGRLYTWYAVTDIRDVCPTGWHVPTDVEWTNLTSFLGGEVVAGGKLKEAETSHWETPNTGATNESGFTALPGGLRYAISSFSSCFTEGGWWSSTEVNTSTAWNRGMYCTSNTVLRKGYFKATGFSVRCIKDN
jgi:uncharacterized protein (TIGR02145 family)